MRWHPRFQPTLYLEVIRQGIMLAGLLGLWALTPEQVNGVEMFASAVLAAINFSLVMPTAKE